MDDYEMWDTLITQINGDVHEYSIAMAIVVYLMICIFQWVTTVT